MAVLLDLLVLRSSPLPRFAGARGRAPRRWSDAASCSVAPRRHAGEAWRRRGSPGEGRGGAADRRPFRGSAVSCWGSVEGEARRRKGRSGAADRAAAAARGPVRDEQSEDRARECGTGRENGPQAHLAPKARYGDGVSAHLLCSPAARRRRRPMDRFYDEQYVRLRNRKLDKYYLHADDDGVGVSISQRRNSLNVAWKVHIYQGSCGPYLLLLSAAYGRYLAATATPAPALYHGFRAELRDYDHPEVPEIMWLDVRAGLGRGVLLLNGRDRYLRANGKYLRWNTGVTVESRDIENEKVSSMMRWIVEPIDLTERAPRIPDPIRARLPEDLSVIVFGRQPGAMREIRFVQASDEGLYNEAGEGWFAFDIRGRSLYYLRDRLAREVNQQQPLSMSQLPNDLLMRVNL